MLRKNSFNGGTAGTSVTTANSGGSSGDAFQSVNGSPTYVAATGTRAPLAALLNDPDTVTWQNIVTAGREMWVRGYVQLASLPASEDLFLELNFQPTSGSPTAVPSAATLARRQPVRRGRAGGGAPYPDETSGCHNQPRTALSTAGGLMRADPVTAHRAHRRGRPERADLPPPIGGGHARRSAEMVPAWLRVPAMVRGARASVRSGHAR
ncbi:hypothetical protein [Nonomuraea basaltis]|uniref:hypothetical protein n=1 Tax=Nonomuraea basaltis TaxID=2495887 RepID=UPI00110C542B|nr:hypothetical protein [Nonomuraea basaltis]TMR97893.1 hypothetical protein EJK15_15415 [Nonomuraea basaltis]